MSEQFVPHYRYNRDGHHTLVANEAHQQALGADWHPHPVSQLSDEEYAALTGAEYPAAPPADPETMETPADAIPADAPKRCKICGDEGHHAGHCPNRAKRG